LLDADSQTKEIEKLRTAIRNYGKELSTIDPDNLNVSDLNNEIDKAGDNINELIAAFKRWA
jgi:small-conductance mechanosensitive channel